MVKYTESQIKQLSELYSLGLSREEACQQLSIPCGSFSYLMKKGGYATRPSGFQKGNSCGKKFTTKSKVKVDCPICGKTIERCDWEVKENRRFCSYRCRSQYYARPGSKHWNWQGGISKRWDKLHNSEEYKQWRMRVFMRDMFKCQFFCDKKVSLNNPLHAHHIKAKSEYPNLVLEVSNGLTLCKECHIQVHRGRHG